MDEQCVMDVEPNALQSSPTLSLTFENFYFQAKTEATGTKKVKTEECDSSTYLEMKMSKPDKKILRQSFLRLVDGRLQTVGFATAQPKANGWRDVVDSMFR